MEGLSPPSGLKASRVLQMSRKRGGDVMGALTRTLIVILAIPACVFGQSAEDNLTKKDIRLPTASAPVANYVPAVRVGSLLFLSGAGPAPSEPRGKVGKDLTLDQAYQAARSTCLNLLAATRATLGTLDKVKRIVKVFGMVNSSPGFTDQPKVVNGCSDLMVEVFGDAVGKHARSAVGMAELPFNIAVEIEMIAEVE
jgi:enamine deaminase RidA (YjgF/YER057c/UK114 family)